MTDTEHPFIVDIECSLIANGIQYRGIIKDFNKFNLKFLRYINIMPNMPPQDFEVVFLLNPYKNITSVAYHMDVYKMHLQEKLQPQKQASQPTPPQRKAPVQPQQPQRQIQSQRNRYADVVEQEESYKDQLVDALRADVSQVPEIVKTRQQNVASMIKKKMQEPASSTAGLNEKNNPYLR